MSLFAKLSKPKINKSVDAPMIYMGNYNDTEVKVGSELSSTKTSSLCFLWVAKYNDVFITSPIIMAHFTTCKAYQDETLFLIHEYISRKNKKNFAITYPMADLASILLKQDRTYIAINNPQSFEQERILSLLKELSRLISPELAVPKIIPVQNEGVILFELSKRFLVSSYMFSTVTWLMRIAHTDKSIKTLKDIRSIPDAPYSHEKKVLNHVIEYLKTHGKIAHFQGAPQGSHAQGMVIWATQISNIVKG